jgi:hypothetical protein
MAFYPKIKPFHNPFSGASAAYVDQHLCRMLDGHTVEMMVQVPQLLHPFQQLQQLQQLHPFQQLQQLQQIQPSIQSVGCVFITRSKTGHFDIIMPSSQHNIYEVFGGEITHSSKPVDCMNSLLKNIGMNVDHTTKSFDIVNPMNSRKYRIYVKYIENTSCQTLSLILQSNPVISKCFIHFTRFPVGGISKDHRIRDDKGHVKHFNTFSKSVITRIAESYQIFL